MEFIKDNYNEKYLSGLGLNERQVKAVLFLKELGVITNGDFQKINRIGKTFSMKELQSLVKRNVLKKVGLKGGGSKYTMAF